MNEQVQIFSEGDFLAGTLTWGWQCFACREEETGFGNASTAAEARGNHDALCPGRPTPTTDPNGESA